MPEETLQWCNSKLTELGYDPKTFCHEELGGEDVFSHSVAYIALKDAVKAQMTQNLANPEANGPKLMLLEKPLAIQRRAPHENVVEAFMSHETAFEEACPDAVCELAQDGPEEGLEPEDLVEPILE